MRVADGDSSTTRLRPCDILRGFIEMDFLKTVLTGSILHEDKVRTIFERYIIPEWGYKRRSRRLLRTL